MRRARPINSGRASFGVAVSKASIDCSSSSLNLNPSGPNNLMPLSKNWLWLAEIITPRSARIDLVSIATAGVGIGPTMTTSMPTLVKPATIADSIMYPLRRVSLPMTTRWR